MFNIKFNKIAFLIAFASYFWVCEARAKLFKADEFYLDNGLRVIVNENHKAPIAKLMLWYKVGSMDEAVGKGGLAHLLEHLMFRGTLKVPDSGLNEIMLENGIENNAFTNRDFTVYHALCDISRLELVMALEADRMSDLKITDEAFAGEQKIVYQERQQRVENNSQSKFSEEVGKILWLGTPYEHPVSGTLEEINALTKEDALSFYKNYYTPSNAVLVISGDVDISQIKTLAEKYYGKIEKRNALRTGAFTFLNKNGGSISIKKEMPHIESRKISISYIIPSVLENPKSAFALNLFSSYLGESGNSYFQKNLVQKNKVLMAGSDVSISSRGSGVFAVFALPLEAQDDNSSIELLEKTISEALSSLTQDKLETEKKKTLSSLVYVDDNPEDSAYIIGELASLGLSLSQIEDYADNINEVTLDDIKTAVIHMLKGSKKVIAVLAPKEGKDIE